MKKVFSNGPWRMKPIKVKSAVCECVSFVSDTTVKRNRNREFERIFFSYRF